MSFSNLDELEYNYYDGIKHGKCIEWNKFGLKKFQGNYKNGKNTNFGDKKAIIEAFKEKTIDEITQSNIYMKETYSHILISGSN